MEGEIKYNICKNITALRKSKKMTQSEFGAVFSFSDKAVSKWESGVSMPDISTLATIAKYFGVSLDDLISSNAVEKKIKLDGKLKKESLTRSIVIMLLEIASVFLAAGIFFIAANIIKDVSLYQSFICAVPVSAFACFFYNKRNEKSQTVYIITASVTCWGAIVSLYVIFLKYNIWQLFFLGLPIEAIILLTVLLKKYKVKK